MRTAVVQPFVSPEVVEILDRMQSLSGEAQEDEVQRLPLRFGRPGVIAALEIGTDEPRTWRCGLYGTDALIDHPEISTPILIEILDQHPLSRVTQTTAYVLGEIGYKQGEDRDPRIVDVALRFLERTHAVGLEEMGPALGLAREISRALPLPEASRYAREYIDEAQSRRIEFSGDYNALGILYQNEGLPFLDELGERTRGLDEDHPFMDGVQTFIAEITGPMVGDRTKG